MQKCYHSGIAHRYGLYSYQLYYSASVDNIFFKYSSCFVSFSSRWDQVVSLLVQKPQNFTEQKMFQTDSRTQVCGPKIVYIVYSCQSKCWQHIDSLYTFKNYVKINWIHKISMKLILKLILRFSFDD